MEVYVAKAFVVKNEKRQVKLLVGNREVEISKDEIRSEDNYGRISNNAVFYSGSFEDASRNKRRYSSRAVGLGADR